VFGGCDGILHVISVETGKQLGEVELGSYVAASAAVYGNSAYVGHYGDEFIAANIGKGSITWRYKDRGFPFFSSPAVTESRIVVGSRDKRVHCLSRYSGKRIWVFSTRGQVDSSPVVCGDKALIGSDDGRLYILRLTDGRQLWSYEIGKPITGSPAVANGRVTVGAGDGVVYAFGA